MSGRISIDNLSDSLKEMIANSGMTEEQIIELLENEEVIDSLKTDSKSIVGAINELFQNANNGKELIANAIGEPLNSNDTFSAMSTKIDSMVNKLKNLLFTSNITSSKDELNKLIDTIKLHGLYEANNIKGVCCGDDFIHVLRYDGNVLSAGNNSFGQLGIGNEDNQLSFVQSNISNVKQISAGCYHTVAVKNDGTVWGCGSHVWNELGVLEESTTETRFSSFKKLNITDVKQVLCADYSTLFLKNDGTVWGCGRNINGVLGIGNTKQQSSFVDSGLTNVKEIFGKYRHIFALKNDGTLWACGLNDNGQLGLGNTTNKSTFTQVNITDVVKVSCGYYHTVVLKKDGTVWGCGDNVNYQLGLGDANDRTTFTQISVSNVYDISCGGHNTLFLKYDGSLYGVGLNVFGQLGTGDTTRIEQITKLSITEIKRIYGAMSFTCVLKKTGSLWVCGDNEYGQLGLNKTDESILVFTNTGIDGAEVVLSGMINGKGIQFAQGNGKQISVNTLMDEGISVNIDFEPRFLFLAISNRNTPSYTSSSYHGGTDTLGVAAICISDLIGADSSRTIGLGAIGNGYQSSYYYDIIFNTGLTDGKITVKEKRVGSSWIYGSPTVDYDWYAIGIGEENDTGGGLDIISATELPATGVTGQLCAITNNVVDEFILSSDISDIVVKDNVIRIQVTDNTNFIKYPYSVGNSVMNYRIAYAYQNEVLLPLWRYDGTQWVQITNTDKRIYLFNMGVYPNPHITSKLIPGYINNSVWYDNRYNNGVTGTIDENGYMLSYSSNTSYPSFRQELYADKLINLSNYTKIGVEYVASLTNGAEKYNYVVIDPNIPPNTQTLKMISGLTTNDTIKEETFDISTVNGMGTPRILLDMSGNSMGLSVQFIIRKIWLE